jgi:hypothetical protein
MCHTTTTSTSGMPPGGAQTTVLEFIALWTLLEAVTKKGLTKIQVLRDSKLSLTGQMARFQFPMLDSRLC